MSQSKATQIVRDRSAFCELGCGRLGEQAAHRLPRSHQGPWMPSNLLRLCTRCHGASEHRRELSYSAGWLIRSGVKVEPWKSIPALILTPGWPTPGWWIPTDDGLFEPVPVGLLPMVCDSALELPDALFRLHASEQELRDLVPAQREPL